MYKITAITPQKKRKGRFNIYLNGKFAFGANEDLVINNRLTLDKTIDDDLLNKLIQEAAFGRLMERMYRLFSIRQRSEKEVVDYWKLKNREARIKGEEEVSEIEIEHLIKNLKKKGMIDDLEFARRWIEERRSLKKMGIIAIRGELISKGVDREIIERILENRSGDLEEYNLAVAAFERKWKRYKDLSSQEIKRKGVGFLLRRGFLYHTSLSVVEKFLKKEYNNS